MADGAPNPAENEQAAAAQDEFEEVSLSLLSLDKAFSLSSLFLSHTFSLSLYLSLSRSLSLFLFLSLSHDICSAQKLPDLVTDDDDEEERADEDAEAKAARLEARAKKIASNKRAVEFFDSFSSYDFVLSSLGFFTVGCTATL